MKGVRCERAEYMHGGETGDRCLVWKDRKAALVTGGAGFAEVGRD